MKQKSLIIGIIGKKRSGKDTFCQAVDGCRFAFADAVKARLCELKGITLENIEADKERWRSDLQAIGTDARKRDKMTWINILRDKLRQHMKTDCQRPVCITDVRFRNEADFVRRIGGKLVRIVRPCNPDNDSHESETEQDTIAVDLTITNIGSLEDFKDSCWLNLQWLKKI